MHKDEEMEHHARFLDWLSYRIAERMSFSSCSQSVDDIWAHDVLRPYQIVLLPGYRVPDSLDRGDKDALWYYRETVQDRPVVVWDGFSAIALFEIIRECFDYSGKSSFIRVRDACSRKLIDDPRDPEILRLRPRRQAGWGRNRIWNHIVELSIWANMLPVEDETSRIYMELVSGHGEWMTETRDSYERAQLFARRGMKDQDLFKIQKKVFAACQQGEMRLGLRFRSLSRGELPGSDVNRQRRDDEVARLDVSAGGCMNHEIISLSDITDRSKPPVSYYRLSAAKGARLLAERRRCAAAASSRPRGPGYVGEDGEADEENPF